jgi:prophage regulatory protein
LKIITFDQLGSIKGIFYSRDHLRRKVKADEFPKPITVSDRRIAWIEAEVDAWLAARVAQRDGKAA